MEKEELLEVEQKFYEKLEGKTDVDEIISMYQRFWEWLVDKDFDDWRPQWRLMRTIQKQIYIHNINCKEHSTKWNGKLVGKIGDFCYKFREKNRNMSYSFKNDQPMQVVFGVLMRELYEERDFATVAYCASILKNSKLLVNENLE